VLEFVIVYLLARHNGRTVEAKGRSGTAYRWGTAGLWFGGEILGAIAGAILTGPRTEFAAVYVVAIGGAVIGAVLAYGWAQGAAPGPSGWAVTPPMGLPAWGAPIVGPLHVMVPPNLAVRVELRQGDWALIRAQNGWSGWVEARYLLPMAAAPGF
jgi:hypothetical protein